MTAFLEFNRILPLIEEAITKNNLQDCLKYIKSYDAFKNYLIRDFAEE